MTDFDFYNPITILFGKGKNALIGEQIKKYGYKKALLLAGGGSIKKNGVYDSVTSSLQKAGVEFVECFGIKPNPNIEKVKEAITIAKKENVDCILAVGGGSVIDTAKTVAAGVYQKDVWDIFAGTSEVNDALPLFTILTLSATGSEMNMGAVITKEDEKKKWNFRSPYVFPKVSIIDPEVQFTLPWNQTANGAVDAMAHTMEYYFTCKNEETVMALDESLLKSVVKSCDALQKNEEDYEARSSLAWAATLALNGISGSMLSGGDWSSHMIEHGVSAFNNTVAHGTGLAIIFPAWIKYTYKENEKTYLRWAKVVWNASSVEEGITNMQEKFKQWKVPTTLTEIGIKEENLEEIKNLITRRIPLFGVVKKLEGEDVLNILKLAL
ncbi:MAG: iron-containing alcohol dehydrogenase [archaeon]